jgi:hypothetical protein
MILTAVIWTVAAKQDIFLEKKNFSKAGHVLAELWSETSIDGHPVVATYVDPDSFTPVINLDTSEEWKAIHVRQSQYCLQIVKCRDLKCCQAPRSSILDILPDRFIPPPIRYVRQDSGPAPAPIESEEGRFGSLGQHFLLKALDPNTEFLQMPFDLYCPSIQDKMAQRIYGRCGLYFSTVLALNNHRKLHRSLLSTTIVVADEDEEEVIENFNSDIYIINDIKKWLNSE